MASERLTLDPTAEDQTNASLELNDLTQDNSFGLAVVGHSYPPPSYESTYASSANSEGESLVNHRAQNREITVNLRVVEPKGAELTNVISSPGFEKTDSWTGVAYGDFTRSTTWSRGDTTFKVSTTPPHSSTVHSVASTTATGNPSTQYAFAIDVNATAANASAYAALKVEFRNGSNTLLTTVTSATGERFTSSGKGRAYLTTTSPASTATMTVTLLIFNNNAAYVAEFDGLIGVLGPTAASYFDGDTPGCYWTGIAHGSPSVREASGGPRFMRMVNDLQAKVAKLNEKGGTLRRIVHGEAFTFDVLGAKLDFTNDQNFLRRHTEVALTFTAKPFARTSPIILSASSETTLPALIFEVPEVKGDVAAIGELTVTNDSTSNQDWMIWGLQRDSYESGATAALLYQAEDLTLQGGSTIASDASASNGSCVITYDAALTGIAGFSQETVMLSTRIASGTKHLTHHGSYRVLMRAKNDDTHYFNPRTPVRLSWGTGDALTTVQNVATTVGDPDANASDWKLVDLGTITIPSTAERWVGYISVAGGVIKVDWLLFVPIDDATGEAEVSRSYHVPLSFNVLTEFGGNTTATALAGQSLQLGGTWSGAGGTDFTVTTDGTSVFARRNTASTARFAFAGASSYALLCAQADLRMGAFSGTPRLGVFARYVDASNYTYVSAQPFTDSTCQLALVRTLAGGALGAAFVQVPYVLSTWATLRVLIDTQGRMFVWWHQAGSSPGRPVMSYYDPAYATGGTLAAGRLGIYDQGTGATTNRDIGGFSVFTPTIDSVIYPSSTATISDTSATRLDPTGAFSSELQYHGDYLRLKPSGREGRKSRVVVKTSRNPVGQVDLSADALTGQLTYTPRYLTVPPPS